MRKRSKDKRPRNVLDEVSAIILNRTHTREGTLKILQSLRTMVRFQPVSRSLGGALPGPEPREEGVDPYDRSNSFLDEGEAGTHCEDFGLSHAHRAVCVYECTTLYCFVSC